MIPDFKNILCSVTDPSLQDELTIAIQPLNDVQTNAQQVLFDFEEFLHLNRLDFNKESINEFIKALEK